MRKQMKNNVPDVKFCLNCGFLFELKYNRYYDEAFKDRPFCSGRCERAYVKKEKRRLEKTAPKHGVLS